MTTWILGALLLGGQEGRPIMQINLTRDAARGQRSLIQVEMSPMDPSRKSPKVFGDPPRPWEFEWLARGYCKAGTSNEYALRFRVYSQERKAKNDRAPIVTRMLTAMWENNFDRLQTDHSVNYNGRIVDVFLCWGGKAGGEQRFDKATEGGRVKAVNTIYFYDLNSFTDPVETAREVAHEYGHAVLPAIGGYFLPESWANGYLGEKLFLSRIREAMALNVMTPEDAMGATKAQLDAWMAKNVDPLVMKAADNLPTKSYMSLKSAVGMDRYTGLALYASQLLPDSVFARSLQLTGSTEAEDYPEAIAMATEEPDRLTLTIPGNLKGKNIWIPLNKAKLTGANVLNRVGKWARIHPTGGEIVLVNRKPEN